MAYNSLKWFESIKSFKLEGRVAQIRVDLKSKKLHIKLK